MSARRKIIWASFFLLAVAVAGGFVLAQSKVGRFTVAQRLRDYGPSARARLAPHFQKAGIAFPPSELVLIGLKEEKRLEIYATSGTNNLKPICSYPVRAASGAAGPKLKEGDGQVPEGIYQIESLNPNSSYHLSLRINYPNAFDRAQAAKENRTNLGGDIMIHGKAVSIGCLAMGDEAAEDLFVLAADTGLKKITIILTPVDFRAGKTLPANAQTNAWTPALYAEIKMQLAKLPAPPAPL